ncbi:hypothetical protein QJS04_geneDACA018348 [Acorus gramineus]|uniref:Uncharacterized protein n=1 Tax=Acorus gramineus TaxID=55184 RepID=A0AAV9A1J6_ACOGR|nr:hypothetical protein QJS04_geneDACA018348 [Acorus gramineus]
MGTREPAQPVITQKVSLSLFSLIRSEKDLKFLNTLSSLSQDLTSIKDHHPLRLLGTPPPSTASPRCSCCEPHLPRPPLLRPPLLRSPCDPSALSNHHLLWPATPAVASNPCPITSTADTAKQQGIKVEKRITGNIMKISV